MPTSATGTAIGSETVQTVQTLSALLGGGPVAVFCAVLMCAVAILFVLLLRSKDAHLRTAVQAMSLAIKLEDAIRENTAALVQARGRGQRYKDSLVSLKQGSGQEGKS